MCREFQDGGVFAEPTEAEIVALLEKATPENTKKQLNMELRFLTVTQGCKNRKWLLKTPKVAQVVQKLFKRQRLLKTPKVAQA